MAFKYSPSFDLLISDNSSETATNTSKLLLKIVTNILNHTTEEKYRTIKTSTNTFMQKLLPISGALQCLLEVGFVEGDDKFTLPELSQEAIHSLRAMKSQIEEHLNQCTNSQVKFSGGSAVSLQKAQNVITAKDLTESQHSVYLKIKSHFDHSLIFENFSLQQKALALIPVSTINDKAEKRLKKLPNFTNRIGFKTNFNLRDCVLLELLDWFKKDFFTWTNSPNCTSCGNESVISIGMLPPSASELAWQAGRVEGYRCNHCGSVIRFPRYNHPEKLLETRTGRCGEWANCFTLLCRSMKFDARHVFDFTDHVWTEVYSVSAKRWLHCDPCENICDKPLLYEKGWGKTLPLVIAASADEIVDVTWRYTAKSILKQRQEMFNEKWLSQTLLKLNKQQQIGWPPQKLKNINDRFFKELIEFITPRSSNAGKYSGRTTGSQSWRQQRGELGSGIVGSDLEIKSAISPTKEELDSGTLVVKYFCAKDVYTRNDARIDSWESMVYMYSDVIRKEEFDWKNVYLARNEEDNSKLARICWKINLKKDVNFCIHKAEIFVKSKTFESGKISWIVCTDSNSHDVENDRNNIFNELSASTFSLHAVLSGGSGDCAWQHTQLFRESLDCKEPSMKIKVHFKTK